MQQQQSWTERNQRAEYIGGACAGGCGIMLFVIILMIIIGAYAFCSNGCS